MHAEIIQTIYIEPFENKFKSFTVLNIDNEVKMLTDAKGERICSFGNTREEANNNYIREHIRIYVMRDKCIGYNGLSMFKLKDEDYKKYKEFISG